jgi:hypothetical protein
MLNKSRKVDCLDAASGNYLRINKSSKFCFDERQNKCMNNTNAVKTSLRLTVQDQLINPIMRLLA